MKTIYLVRHGESEGNAAFIYQMSDTPLTEQGRVQAEFIAKRASKLPVEAIIASPMERAKETAAAISKRNGLLVEYSELFKERRTASQLWGKGINDPNTAHIKDAMHRFDVPGYRHSNEENFDDLKARANEALAFLEGRREDHILVVSHGFFLRVLTGRILYGPDMTGKECLQALRALRTRNTGLSVLHFNGDVEESDEGPAARWQLYVWNDHAHLG